MTKEEFLSIFRKKLEELEAAQDKAIKKIEYLQKMWGNSNETHKAEQEKEAIGEEISFLRGFVHIPAYERIMAMSDVEIATYKEDIKKDRDAHISTKMAKRKVLEEEIAKLKAQEEANVDLYAAAKTEREKNDLINKGREIGQECARKEAEIREIDLEIKALEQSKVDLDNKSSEEIKNQMISKLTLNNFVEKNSLDNNRQKGNYEVNGATKLLASVDGNPEKTEALRAAFLKFTDLKKFSSVNKPIYLDFYKFPSSIKRKLEFSFGIDIDHGDVRDLNALKEVEDALDKFIQEANDEKKLIDEEFTADKMVPLYDETSRDIRSNSEEVDFDFLRKHKGKISEDEINLLANLVNEKAVFERKIIKTKGIKEEIKSLTREIKEERDKLYDKIKAWYENAAQNKLTRTMEGSFGSTIYLEYGDIRDNISDIKNRSNSTIENTAQLKEKIAIARANKEKVNDDYDQARKKIVQEILDIVGAEFTEKDIPYLSEENMFEFDKRVKVAGFIVNTLSTAKEVQVEAQRQADEKEAEIRGITLEKLMELRKQAAEAKAAQVVQTPTEGNNPGGLGM